MPFKLVHIKKAVSNRNVLVDLFAILFGVGSWIGINSIQLQLPLLVKDAPEGWNLPAYFSFFTQLGNIGPLLYTLFHRSFPNRLNDSIMIYVLYTIGGTAILLISIFFQETVWIGGTEFSLPLLILVFFMALVGCTSSVLFMPYMGRFRDTYLVTYLIGEGFSGFLPSIVALVQGVGGNSECILTNMTDGTEKLVLYKPPPRFGTTAFFVFVFVTFMCSAVAFWMLDNLKMSKKEHAAGTVQYGNNYKYDTPAASEGEKRVKYLSKKNYIMLLVLMAVVCLFGHGVFHSIQSYSNLPYGNVAYHFTMTLAALINPLVCFLAMFLRHTSIRAIVYSSAIAVLFTIYCITTALMSPSPPLHDSKIGPFVIVFAWTVLFGLFTYIKLGITSIFRLQGDKSLVWTGSVTQIGAFCGSMITFSLINFTSTFTSYTPC